MTMHALETVAGLETVGFEDVTPNPEVTLTDQLLDVSRFILSHPETFIVADEELNKRVAWRSTDVAPSLSISARLTHPLRNDPFNLGVAASTFRVEDDALVMSMAIERRHSKHLKPDDPMGVYLLGVFKKYAVEQLRMPKE